LKTFEPVGGRLVDNCGRTSGIALIFSRVFRGQCTVHTYGLGAETPKMPLYYAVKRTFATELSGRLGNIDARTSVGLSMDEDRIIHSWKIILCLIWGWTLRPRSKQASCWGSKGREQHGRMLTQDNQDNQERHPARIPRIWVS